MFLRILSFHIWQGTHFSVNGFPGKIRFWLLFLYETHQKMVARGDDGDVKLGGVDALE